MDSGVIYPDVSGGVASISKIRELSGANKIPWVQIVKEDVWVKLINVGTLYRNTRLWAAFEASRDGTPPDRDREWFRICRTQVAGSPGRVIPTILAFLKGLVLSYTFKGLPLLTIRSRLFL